MSVSPLDPTMPKGAPSAELEEVRPRGAALGRYILLDRLGAGGMGVVYAAFDPKLDRKVAVKILHEDRASVDRQERLTREAQAMARLSHPNVVPVHDVGVDGGTVFVAMDFVDGQTLSAWRAERSRSWREVLKVFLAAGQGLAAAHAKGLVHRDFKPDNVLLRAADGHVMVSDFGLARLAGEISVAGERPSSSPSPSSLERELTKAGVLMGTPAYMAPEQHRAEAADARSDQFAFCVALYEALYGERPFVATEDAILSGADALALEIIKGNVRPAPRQSSVPGWVRRIVVRGLCPAPGERWPSMNELLAALRHDPGRALRGWLLAGAVVAAAAVGVIGMTRHAAHQVAVCTGAGARVEAVWNDAVKAKGAQAFAQTGKSYAADTWQRVQHQLDAYTADWAAMHTQTCEATELRHEQSPDLLDLRMACLDRKLAAFGALVTLFGENVDAPLVGRAISAASSLPPISACADLAGLRAQVPLPDDPTVRRQVKELDLRLAQIEALELAGKLKQGLETLGPLLDQARQLAYPVTLAYALFLRAHMLQESHDLPGAETAIKEALNMAADAHQDERVATLLGALEWTYSNEGHVDQGLALTPATEAALHRAGDPPHTHIAVLNSYGQLLQHAGRYAEAEKVLREAIELQERVAPHDMEITVLHYSLGSILTDEAKYAEARGELELSLKEMTGLLGPDNPRFIGIYIMRGNLEYHLHELAAAGADYQAALRESQATLGPDSEATGTSWNNVAIILEEQGKLEEAEQAYQHGLAIRLKMGPDHPLLAESYHNLAGLYRDEGQPAKALEYASKALAIKEKAHGKDHPELEPSLQMIALALLDLDRAPEAKVVLDRALALTEKSLPADHPRLAELHVVSARVYLKLGKPAAAVPLLEDAIAHLDVKQPEGGLRGEARYLLGVALWTMNQDRPAARRQVEEARAIYEQLGENLGVSDRQHLEEAKTWLAAHAG